MKLINIYNKVLLRISLSLSIFMYILYTTSCSKDILTSNEQESFETQITVNIAGINETDIIHPIDKNASVSKDPFDENNLTPHCSAKSSLENQNGLTLDATSEQTPINSRSLDNQLKHPFVGNNKNTPKVAALMTKDFTYRIFIYANNSPKLWKTVEAKAGTPIKLEVAKGSTYKWFAYSYNNTQSLPIPTNTENPTVDAPINKDLLYASGQLTIPKTPAGESHVYPINITFSHRMAKITVRIDANTLKQYANIKGLKAVFSRNDYLKNGVFNIKNNVMDSYEVVPFTEIFNTTTPNATNIWEASFYTADVASLTSYKVKVTDLPVTFTGVAANIADVNLATFQSSTTSLPNIESTFNYSNPAAGQNFIGKMNLSYTLSSRRILHVSNTTDYGYSFQKGPSWEMINALENFGNLPTSIVRMQPYATGQGVWIGGNSENDISENFINAAASTSRSNEIMARINSTDQNVRPDIVILAYDHYYMTSQLQDALVKYINDGGVCIMMNEFTTDANGPESFINKLFNNPTTKITLRNLGSAGSMYRLLNVNDRVLNGPFGDARQKLWGEDASTSVGALNLPADQVVIYSYGQPINRAADATDAITVSMFRHATKNFFYLGDGGLISYNGGTSSTICPFDFDPTTKRPIPKLYGNAGNGYAVRSDYAYNGIIAGNIMLWAGELAEFHGIKKWKYKPD